MAIDERALNAAMIGYADQEKMICMTHREHMRAALEAYEKARPSEAARKPEPEWTMRGQITDLFAQAILSDMNTITATDRLCDILSRPSAAVVEAMKAAELKHDTGDAAEIVDAVWQAAVQRIRDGG